uniref:Uncharacterized protein n=1 Tax=Tanacetum cinerariifolium TaxID=118510 RepID=A0A699GY63_TANCI|nr:hypothetical protein [Tanacetum cinerariifolium]
MVFEHDDDQCPNHVVADFGKQSSKAYDKLVNAPRKAFRNFHVGGPEFRPTNHTKGIAWSSCLLLLHERHFCDAYEICLRGHNRR